MRDSFKEKEYFDKIIVSRNEILTDGFDKLEKGLVPDSRKEHFASFLSQQFFNLIKAKYSRGDDLSNQNSIDLMIRSIDLMTFVERDNRLFYRKGKEIVYLNQFSLTSYIGVVQRLSLAFLMNINKEKYEILIDYIDKSNVKDFLIEFLIISYGIKRDVVKEESYQKFFDVNDKFKLLKEVILETDNIIAEQKLKLFLEKKWFNLFKGTPSYNEHLKNNDSYSGYWCFVAAAVVKIKGLNDITFRNNKYYPKDLI